MLENLDKLFAQVVPAVDFCSLRFVRDVDEIVSVRQDVPQPVAKSDDQGVMITVMHDGGLGYGATCDLSLTGLQHAVEQAKHWAAQTAGRSVIDYRKIEMPSPKGEYASKQRIAWDSVPLTDKLAMLSRESRRLKADDRIVDWEASLWHTDKEVLYLTSGGGRVCQKYSFLAPSLTAIANSGVVTQRRTHGGPRGFCRQGGMELLDDVDFYAAAEWLPREAIALLEAPNCPTGAMDILIDPDQMILQIHESVGHPLELDRILGDERNYAGTSFVTPDMIGSYQYGSELMNITFDPTRREQLATYAFDDDGLPASKQFLIEKGVLKRVLGGGISQARAGIAGVANSRATSWNRPPIDRMANINLEPGDSSLAKMIAAVKRGVYVKSNCSWSIDDSRNKFQFGCEWGQLIEDGKLTTIVKNPNYRGISATFWRNLAMVGDESTFVVMGTPNCGKGEPNQIIRTGHGSPTCLFKDVEVFGGV